MLYYTQLWDVIALVMLEITTWVSLGSRAAHDEFARPTAHDEFARPTA